MRIVNEKFADLGTPRRVWAIAAINGNVERLSALHDHIATRFAVRDRVVYLGNYVGSDSAANNEVFDELLAFRSALLAKTGVEPTDIVHLRGVAEEAWQRLLRLQFAPAPSHTLDRLLSSGVEAYLRLYGISLSDTMSMARAGSVAITRWTGQLRSQQRLYPGHDALFCSMRRAAYTEPFSETYPQRLLFVPAGFDFTQSIEDQGESLWWPNLPFHLAGPAVETYHRLVRGFDANNNGPQLEEGAVTLDAGCGRGGPLTCGCFTMAGNLIELIAVGGHGAIQRAPYEEDENESLADFAPVPAPAQTWEPVLQAAE